MAMDRYKNACRICLKEDSIKIPIFGDEGQYRGVAAKIKECCSIPIYPNDPLPKNICNQCFYKISLAAEVKEQCLRSNAVLIRYLSTQRGNEAARDYLSLVQDRRQSMPPPSLHGQKRKLPEMASPKTATGPPSKRPGRDPAGNTSARSMESTYNISRSGVLNNSRTTRRSSYIPPLQVLPPQEPKFPCQACSKVFSNRKMLMNHERLHSADELLQSLANSLPYSCKICGRSFERPKSLKMHSIKYHKILLKEAIPNRRPTESISSNASSSLSLPKMEDDMEDGQQYKCDVCDQVCPNESSLQDHVRNEHSGVNSVPTEQNVDTRVEEIPLTKPECIYCFQAFKNNNGLVGHLRTAHGKPSCSLCLEIFTTQEELLAHRSIHKAATTTTTTNMSPKKSSTIDDNEEPPVLEIAEPLMFKCNLCQKSFDKHISYVRHKAYHTKMGPTWIPSEILAAQQQFEQTPQTSHANNISSERLDLSDLEESGNTENIFKIKKNDIKKLKQNNTKIPYCIYCKKIYNSHQKLWDHVRKIHPSSPRYKCPHAVCARVFFSKTGYRSHLSTHKEVNNDDDDDIPELEREESPLAVAAPRDKEVKAAESLECDICEKPFFNVNNLSRHILERHKNMSLYQCNKCVRVCFSQEQLTHHINFKHIHPDKAGKKRAELIGKTLIHVYPKVLCRYCPKYLSKKYVIEHEKVHRRSGHKPLVRNNAHLVNPSNQASVSKAVEKEDTSQNKPTATNSNSNEKTGPNSMINKKKKAVCKFCDIVCISFKSLRLHLKDIHDGEQYFLCDSCPEVYFDPAAMKSHHVRHTRSYKKCIHCDRSFAYLNYLKVHEKNCPMKKRKYVMKSSVTATTSNSQPSRASNTNTTIYTCKFCGAQFLETNSFVKHLQGHAK